MVKNKVPQWLLERYLLQELDGSKMAEVEQLIGNDHHLRERLQDLRKSNQAVLTKYPVDQISKQIQTKMALEASRSGSKFPSSLTKILHWSPILAAAIIVALVGFQLINQQQSGNPNGSVRSKGNSTVDTQQPHLLIHRKRGDAIELLKNGSTAWEGDLLQLAYIPAQKTFGMIFSVDGKGVVTLHFPSQPSGSTLLQAKKKTYLSNAYQLDDAPQFERFFFITANSPINVKKILQSARLLAKNINQACRGGFDLSSKYEQFSILIQKGEKR